MDVAISSWFFDSVSTGFSMGGSTPKFPHIDEFVPFFVAKSDSIRLSADIKFKYLLL
jgi:hypothetical protein